MKQIKELILLVLSLNFYLNPNCLWTFLVFLFFPLFFFFGGKSQLGEGELPANEKEEDIEMVRREGGLPITAEHHGQENLPPTPAG